MFTVLSESNQLSIPEELARAAGLHAGSQVEVTVTAQGVLVRPSGLSREKKLALLSSLEGDGQRRLPAAKSQVEALLRDRAESNALDLSDELD